MFKLAYDMHIHSCLSPCGDENMTPANIAGMAHVKKLDVISLTDHNTCRNCPALIQNAEEYGIIVIPGIEITTSEDIHVLGYFSEIEKAMQFDEYVYNKLIKVRNNAKVFGKQTVLNYKEEVIKEEENLLINATKISFEEVFDVVNSFGGISVPAHINKNANSVMSILGVYPADSKFKCVEYSEYDACLEAEVKNVNILKNSDAHFLENISEATNYFFVQEKNSKSILDSIYNRK